MQQKPSLLNQLPVHTDKKGWPWTEETDANIYAIKNYWPKISIVTPSYNQGKYIEETIRSILLQNYPNLEFVIIDGGSSDETQEIIEKYERWINYWMSEKDNGQADAINKGIKICSGQVFNWINSDDLLNPRCLFHIGILFREKYTIAGKVYNFYEQSPELNYYIQNQDLTFETFLSFKHPFHQPGIWYDLDNFKATGLLSTKYSYYFDRIFLIDYLFIHKTVIYTDEVLVNFRMHPASKTSTVIKEKSIELIDHYKYLIANRKYDAYCGLIKRKLFTYLIPGYLIDKWGQKSAHYSHIRQMVSFFFLFFKYPRILLSRYYYTMFKKYFFKDIFTTSKDKFLLRKSA